MIALFFFRSLAAGLMPWLLKLVTRLGLEHPRSIWFWVDRARSLHTNSHSRSTQIRVHSSPFAVSSYRRNPGHPL